MCGIAGIVHADRNTPVSEAVLRTMCETLHHRRASGRQARQFLHDMVADDAGDVVPRVLRLIDRRRFARGGHHPLGQVLVRAMANCSGLRIPSPGDARTPRSCPSAEESAASDLLKYGHERERSCRARRELTSRTTSSARAGGTGRGPRGRAERVSPGWTVSGPASALAECEEHERRVRTYRSRGADKSGRPTRCSPKPIRGGGRSGWPACDRGAVEGRGWRVRRRRDD